VLRTEIRARLKGEGAAEVRLLAAREEAASATHAVSSKLDESIAANSASAGAISREVASCRAHVEAEISTMSGRLESVAGRQSAAIAALHKEHTDLVRATRSAIAQSTAHLEREIAELEGRRKAEVLLP
jgi:hypothetical protein